MADDPRSFEPAGSARASEIEPGRRGLLLGIRLYRFASFGLMVVLAAFVELRAPGPTWLMLAALGSWIVAITWLGAWERRWVRWVDVAASVGLLFVAPLLVAEGRLLDEPLFAASYPLASVMTWAASNGVTGGLMAAAATAAPLALSRRLNGIPFVDHDQGAALGILTGIVYYALGGVLIGLFAGTMERAGRRVRAANEVAARERELAARLRERESLARRIHDSVLASLAVAHRRGRDLAARTSVEPTEVAGLLDLIDAQERQLRSLLRDVPADPPPGAVPLRTVLEAAAFGIVGVDVSVTTIDPAWMPAAAAEEVSAAVRAALDNVVRHASATQAAVFGERSDAAVLVSIRDDGVGFRVEEAIDARNGRFGLSRSIRGRIEDLGGDVRIESAPGRGTEIELRIPVVDAAGSMA